jgi:glycine/D-amino acid oxidase-like deaminating enzyme
VGLYDVTPDWHPLLGPVEGFEGLHLATGGSGHCFKLGPAIGQMVAGGVLGLETQYADLARFSVGRFADGKELHSTYGGNRA